MLNVLHELLPCLQANVLLQSAAAPLPTFPPLVTWVDDLAIPIPSLRATDLDGLVLGVLGCVQRIMASYGLQLNMQKGKAELVCQYHGRVAVACRHRRFIEHTGNLALPDGRSLHIAGQYHCFQPIPFLCC